MKNILILSTVAAFFLSNVICIASDDLKENQPIRHRSSGEGNSLATQVVNLTINDEALQNYFYHGQSAELFSRTEREVWEEALKRKGKSVEQIHTQILSEAEIEQKLKEKEALCREKSDLLTQASAYLHKMHLPYYASMSEITRLREDLELKRTQILERTQTMTELKPSSSPGRIFIDPELLSVETQLHYLGVDRQLLEQEIEQLKKEIKEIGQEMMQFEKAKESLQEAIDEYEEMKRIKLETNVDLYQLRFNDGQLFSNGDFIQTLVELGIPKSLLQEEHNLQLLKSASIAKLELPVGRLREGNASDVLTALREKTSFLIKDVEERYKMSANATGNLIFEMQKRMMSFRIGMLLPTDENPLYMALVRKECVTHDESLFFSNFLAIDFLKGDERITSDTRKNLLRMSHKNATNSFIGALYNSPFPIDKLRQRELPGWLGLAYIMNNITEENKENADIRVPLNDFLVRAYCEVYFYKFNLDLLYKIQAHINGGLLPSSPGKTQKFIL
jgi:hypothetical protein